jgi:ATP-dependent Clp protease protease subunit
MSAPLILDKAPRQGAYVDLATYLLERRTLFIGPELTNVMASTVSMQILALLQEEREISLYINCYGGSVPAGLAIADMVDYAGARGVPVHTYCLGECVGVATVILASGTEGERRAFPSARISLYQEWYGIESMWGAMSQDSRERSRLMELVQDRLLRRTHIGSRLLEEVPEAEFGVEEWEALRALFPEEETGLQRLVTEREGKVYLDVAGLQAEREAGRIRPRTAEEIARRSRASRFAGWLQRLEFLGPAEAMHYGLIDGLAGAPLGGTASGSPEP